MWKIIGGSLMDTDEKTTIKKFTEILEFPHVCKGKERKLQLDEDQFTLRQYRGESTDHFYLSIQCARCGYGKEIVIDRREALILRKYYIEQGIYNFDQFKRMECALCRFENILMEHCPYYTRRILGVCRGLWTEEEETKKHIANTVFP